MESAVSQVKSGEITQAIRNSQFNNIEIKKGNYIGIYNDSIVATNKKQDSALISLLKKIITNDDSIISIFYQSQNEDVKALHSKLKDEFPDFDIETYYGGQPHYAYIISVE